MSHIETSNADSVLRAMTDDGAFRVVTARMTDTVAQALSAQEAWGENGRYLGELLTGAVLVRETMAPTHRVQALFRTRDRRGELVADAHPDGGNRGLMVRRRGLQEISLRDGTLELMRTLYNGEIHRSLVRVPDRGGLSETLMTYMAVSEQVASMIAVACVLEDQKVRAAGGYIVQLLPEVGRAPLAIMTERLRDFERIEKLMTAIDAAPSALLDELLYGMPFTRLDHSPLSFKCRCNTVRVMGALASLGRDELSELVREEQLIEMACDYCGQQYAVSPGELQGLMQQS
ncbi:MAG: Hsp33 family molecular chaperone HslO [Polyangiales bacterium]